MSLIVWQESYSVGVGAIDRDHRLIINLINQLHDAHETAQTTDVVSSVLNILCEYVERHFAVEEVAMERGGYPHIEQHRREHRRLSERVQEMRQLYADGEYAAVGPDMLIFLTHWLSNHILGPDMRYRPWVQGIEVSHDELVATFVADGAAGRPTDRM